MNDICLELIKQNAFIFHGKEIIPEIIFVDDTNLFSNNIISSQKGINVYYEEVTKLGLKLNEDKTYYGINNKKDIHCT